MAHKAIPRSVRPKRPGTRAVGKLHYTDEARISLYLRPRPRDKRAPSPSEGRHLTLDEYEAFYGAHPEEMRRVLEFAQRYGFEVTEHDLLKRRVKLSGSAKQVKKAFKVEMLYYEHDEGLHHGHEGPVHVPESLHGIVTSVFGLDNQAVARRQSPAPRLRRHPRTALRKPAPMPEGEHLTPAQAGQAYAFPPGLDGSGQCIGIVQLDGGFNPRDIETYFKRLKIGFNLNRQLVTCGPNRYAKVFDPDHGKGLSDAEVAMDLELAAGLAPGAKFVIHFAEGHDSRSNRSFVDTVADAILDREHRPGVMSISWASPEAYWVTINEDGSYGRSAECIEMEQLIRHASEHLGVTVCVSAGDYGAHGAKPEEFEDHFQVTFPGSAPHALACGGTNLDAPDGRYRGETVWESSTGGVSALFKRPAYQKSARVPKVPKKGYRPGFQGAGVPDVAGNASMYDPGYLVMVHGIWAPDPPAIPYGGGGTSAVAPVWAALVARLNQGLGRRLGFLHPELYALRGSKAFHPITEGSNGHYKARTGWNACTGLGTPNGIELLERLK